MRERRGHTLVETLVVLGIVMGMMAIALPHYSKAIGLAKEVAGNEAKRQTFMLSYFPFQCPEVSVETDDATYARSCARAAYRQRIDAGKFDLYITELRYQVLSNAEFVAYWYTLIGPDEAVSVEYSVDGSLIAYDDAGVQHVLPPVERSTRPEDVTATYVVAWDFLSTNMGHMNTSKRGTTVVYNTGQLEYVKYPAPLPNGVSSELVAALSNMFMQTVWQGD